MPLCKAVRKQEERMRWRQQDKKIKIKKSKAQDISFSFDFFAIQSVMCYNFKVADSDKTISGR